MWCYVAALCLSIQTCSAYNKLSLQGDHWIVSNGNGSIHVLGRVPGGIYTDLHRAGYLGTTDLYYRFNDVTTRWVSYDNWTYVTQFSVSSELLKNAVVELVAEGLDTVAMVKVNGQTVGSSNNMFRRYVWNIKDQLQEGLNIVGVNFTSSVWYGAQQARKYPYTVPPECPPDVQHGECHTNFVRKEAASSSWDWGPAFPTMGIWKDIYIQGYNTAVLRDVKVTTVRNNIHKSVGNGGWYVNTLVCLGAAFKTGNVTVGLMIPDIASTSAQITITPQQTCWELKLHVSKDVKLWWPHGVGDQTLYDLHVILTTSEHQTIKLERIGFRTINLIQKQITGLDGLSFYFNVNEFPVFMKGSNWIPADAFQERITENYLRRLLQSAVDANINILRVWGGGVYESEMFYSLADELGILIWQDLMFACSMYPTDKEFLDNVREEVTHQVRRLGHHPSIIIWAGNNENEVALAQNWYKTSENYSQYYKDYVSLYIETVGQVVKTEDTSRPYVTSSPSNGLDTQQQGWVAKNPQNELYGDVHYYNYTQDTWDWSGFPTPRFASEYGIQAWPSLQSLKQVSQPGDLTFNSTFVNHRQHHESGNQQILDEIAMNLRVPQQQDEAVWFSHFVYLSQVNQAMGIKTESEHYRRGQHSQIGGKGLTMGAFYWQLNDIWQAPTWASLEYGGKWKMLHYYVKNFFAQTLLSPYINGTELLVHYIEDKMPTGKAYKYKEYLKHKEEAKLNSVFKVKQDFAEQLIITCYSWDSQEIKKQWTTPFNESSNGGGIVFKGDVDSMLREAGCPSSQHCVFHFALLHSSAQNWISPSKIKDAIGLKKVTIAVKSVVHVGGMEYMLELSSDGVAAFVWLDTVDIEGRFSDNGFIIFSSTTIVYFYSWQPIADAAELHKAVTIMSLMDVYTVR